jgi:ElaB/YqjD/DUF883 family membrane-anchored ribosome-binding protein
MAVSPSKKPAAKPAAKAKPAATKAKPVTAKAAPAAKAKKPTAKLAIQAPASGTNKSKVKDDMNNFKDKASDAARNAAERSKEKASEAAFSIGKILRDSAETIDTNVGKNFGDYARSAADAVDGFAGKIETKDVDAMVDDARNFVRKSPAVAVGAAAAIGFVLVRMLRSGKDA